jgi:hypothetical protein
LRFSFLTKLFGIGFKARQKTSKSIVCGSVSALRQFVVCYGFFSPMARK